MLEPLLGTVGAVVLSATLEPLSAAILEASVFGRGPGRCRGNKEGGACLVAVLSVPAELRHWEGR